QEHRLPLAVRAYHQVMEAQRQFHDRIEARKRAVARPHFLDQNATMARAEKMHHPPGQDRLRKPFRGRLDLRLLRRYQVHQFAATTEIFVRWSHGHRFYRWMTRTQS